MAFTSFVQCAQIREVYPLSTLYTIPPKNVYFHLFLCDLLLSMPLARIMRLHKLAKENAFMAKKPVLVVMAAGMGSRYGGLKQIDPVGSQGEAILDYSIYDAHQAGFETVVIIIKEAIKKDFMETVGKRLEKAPVEIRYAYQELDKLPAGIAIPEGLSLIHI